MPENAESDSSASDGDMKNRRESGILPSAAVRETRKTGETFTATSLRQDGPVRSQSRNQSSGWVEGEVSAIEVDVGHDRVTRHTSTTSSS